MKIHTSLERKITQPISIPYEVRNWLVDKARRENSTISSIVTEILVKERKEEDEIKIDKGK